MFPGAKAGHYRPQFDHMNLSIDFVENRLSIHRSWILFLAQQVETSAKKDIEAVSNWAILKSDDFIDVVSLFQNKIHPNVQSKET